MQPTTDVLDVRRVATIERVGLPPLTVRFSYRAVLSMMDAGEILTRMRIAATPAPSAIGCVGVLSDRHSAGQNQPSTLQVVAQ